MVLTHFIVATALLSGASADLFTSAGVTTTVPLALGMMNSASSAASVTGVVNCRITSSMA